MPRLLAALVCLATALAAEPVRMELANGDFEAKLDGWHVDDPMCTLSTEQPASGQYSLKVVDTDDKDGSNTTAARIAIPGAGFYQLRGKVYPVSGNGLGIYVRVLDAAGKLTAPGDQFQRGAPSEAPGKWTPFTLDIYCADGDRLLELWLHSYMAAQVTAYLDDFELWQISAGGQTLPPPWTPQYKLRPEDRDKLTAADVVGPDGLVYPNWRNVGIAGGIPDVAVKAEAADFGAVADDDRDDGAAIAAAAAKVGEAGGGAVQLAAGVYYLDRPITIQHDGVVLRGAGRDRTRLVFRYDLGEKGIRWAEPLDGGDLYRNSVVTLHADPNDLQAIEIRAGDQVLARRERSTHWGNTFSVSAWSSAIAKVVPTGADHVTLRGIAHYSGDKTRAIETTFAYHADRDDPTMARRVGPEAAIGFGGRDVASGAQRIKLAEDGQRGSLTLRLESTDGLAAGDRIVLDGPATERWKKLTRNACLWGTYRRNILQLARVNGDTIELTEPLRIEFPVVDGALVYKTDPILRCGIEDLTIEQTQNLWITTVLFRSAWECWARNVKVVKCGRFPIYGSMAKRCVIQDCELEDAWYKGGGGTAYAGWELSYDCLMDHCETWRLRHAPCVQWSASGCVIRNSVFHDSDMQWHSGWTNENLFENLVVESATGNGGYGHGAWASPPEDTAHGPNGPRNVVYHCDIQGQKAGIWMGGMNENWLLVYNRLVAGGGQAIFAKTSSFDHVIRGNVFVVSNERYPAIQLASPDCSGIEVYGNRLYGGNGKMVMGASQPLVDQDNQVLPLTADAPMPDAPVASIYEWQRAAQP